MRPAFRLVLAGLVTGIAIYATTFLHELGHLIAGRLIGLDARLDTVISVAYYDRPTVTQNLVFSAAGPAVTVVLSLVGLAVCARFRASDSIAMTVVRGVTAITLVHVGLSLLFTPVGGPTADISSIIALLDTPLPVRMLLTVLGLLLVVVAALVFGRWALRADPLSPVRIGRWRAALAAVLAVGQLVLLVVHLVDLTSPTPGVLSTLDLIGAMVLLPVIGGLLTPWRQEGVRALVRRDAVPIWIGYGLQVVLSIVASVPYALSLFPVFGTVMIGMAVAARARQSSSPAVEAAG